MIFLEIFPLFSPNSNYICVINKGSCKRPPGKLALLFIFPASLEDGPEHFGWGRGAAANALASLSVKYSYAKKIEKNTSYGEGADGSPHPGRAERTGDGFHHLLLLTLGILSLFTHLMK